MFVAQEQMGLGQFQVKCSIGRLVCWVVNFLLYTVFCFYQHQLYGPLIRVVLFSGAGVHSMRLCWYGIIEVHCHNVLCFSINDLFYF